MFAINRHAAWSRRRSRSAEPDLEPDPMPSD
jgi:hypothetical protein